MLPFALAAPRRGALPITSFTSVQQRLSGGKRSHTSALDAEESLCEAVSSVSDGVSSFHERVFLLLLGLRSDEGECRSSVEAVEPVDAVDGHESVESLRLRRKLLERPIESEMHAAESKTRGCTHRSQRAAGQAGEDRRRGEGLERDPMSLRQRIAVRE